MPRNLAASAAGTNGSGVIAFPLDKLGLPNPMLGVPADCKLHSWSDYQNCSQGRAG
jgi:hypothetical protein